MSEPNPDRKDDPQHFQLMAGIILGLLIAGWVGFLFGFDQPTMPPPAMPSYVERQNAAQVKSDTSQISERIRRPCLDVASESQSDLCAQWTAASAAVRSANEAHRATNWAIIGIAVGCLTVFGLFFTIRQTAGSIAEARESNRIAAAANEEARRRALDDAADTAKAIAAAERNAHAADRQVEVASSTAKRQLRAYLHMRGIYFSDIENYPLDIHFKAKNYGLTPAHNIKLYAAFTVVDLRAPAPLSEPQLVDGVSTAPVGKSHFYTTHYRPWDRIPPVPLLAMQRSLLADMQAGRTLLDVRGKLTYVDVFGDMHTTNFHVILGRVTGMRKMKDPKGVGERYGVGYYPDGNDAD